MRFTPVKSVKSSGFVKFIRLFDRDGFFTIFYEIVIIGLSYLKIIHKIVLAECDGIALGDIRAEHQHFFYRFFRILLGCVEQAV